MKLKALALLLVTPVLLSACGGDSSSKGGDTQVAAKVNSEEITVHELNQILGNIRVKVTADNQSEIKQKALESLVDQTLILQAAKNAKLDRTPEVLSQIEAAKRKVLVDAYMQRTLKGVGKPSQSEVEEFYKSRPEIFSDRKMFIYTQMTIAEKPENIEALIEKIKDVKTLDLLIAQFDEDKITYNKTSEMKMSEKVPAPLLKPLNTLKVGDIGYLKMSDGLLVIGLESTMPQPVSLEQAKPAIERQLYAQKQKEAAGNLVESLKEAAQIEYLGEFAVEYKGKNQE